MLETRDIGIDVETVERLFDQLPDCPFFIKDRRLRYVAANDAMVRLCGVKRRADILGRTAASFFPEAFVRRYEALDRQVLATGHAVTSKLDLSIGARAVPTWLLFARFPVRAADGAIVAVAATSRRLGQPDRNHPTYARLAAVVQRLQDRFDQPLDLTDLASLASVSRSQLERDFKRLFHLTPQDFLHKLRIDRALKLLEGDLSVAAVAQECGYADHSAFTRRFREQIGMPPQAYRMRLAQGG